MCMIVIFKMETITKKETIKKVACLGCTILRLGIIDMVESRKIGHFVTKKPCPICKEKGVLIIK